MAFNVPLKNTIAKQRPVTKQTPWVRPADWINITGVNDNEVIYLVSDMGDKTFKLYCATFSGADIYVDWGDGTIDTVAHSTSIEHTYSTGGTPCSRGYNTFKIRVYVGEGVILSSANFIQTSTQRRSNFPVYLLEAYFGNGSNLSFAGRFTGNGFNYPILEYVKMPTTLTGGQNSLDSTFYNCRSLYKVDMPTSASVLTNIQYVFYQCYNLQTIAIPSDATEISSMTFAFNGCNSLTSISLPTTLNSVTSLANTFNTCSALGTMILPSTNACTSFSGTFSGCVSLTYASIKSMAPSMNLFTNAFSACRSLISVDIMQMPNGGGILDMSNTFQNCGLLTSVKMAAPALPLSVTASSTFSNCGSLQYIKLPTNFNATTMLSAFANCVSLQRIDMPTSMPGLTNLGLAFNNCNSLTDINFPATVGTISTFSQAFSGCNSISEITIPATWTCSSATFSSTFANCTNLTKVNLLATFIGSPLMDSMFNNCYSLETIVTSASFNTILSNTNGVNTMFQNCSSLKEFTFPATMATSTFQNTFSGCSALRSVTMPTTATSVTTFQNAFFNCTALKSVTLPATVSATVSTFTAAFQNCISLETVTLPVTQITSSINATNMFNGCFALKTINNVDKFGSTSTTGNIVNFTLFKVSSEELISLTLVPRISKLEVQGTATNVSKLNLLRLTNTGTGQWSGTSPQINVSFTDITYANLVTLFNDIAAQGNVTAKTINITSCAGAASLTAADRLILTSKGWTITG